jgi:hypothetical protein
MSKKVNTVYVQLASSTIDIHFLKFVLFVNILNALSTEMQFFPRTTSMSEFLIY